MSPSVASSRARPDDNRHNGTVVAKLVQTETTEICAEK